MRYSSEASMKCGRDGTTEKSVCSDIKRWVNVNELALRHH
jgi:hypothetical protein